MSPTLAPLPHATRSDVFTALFEFIKTIPPPTGGSWKTFSQTVRAWDQVDASAQPAIFLHRGPQTAEQKHAFGVIKWTWHVILWVYYRVDGYQTENTYPDQLTDIYLDGIEQLFQTDPLVGRLNLGGLVHHCWIDGQCVADPGIGDNQAVIVIPLSILL